MRLFCTLAGLVAAELVLAAAMWHWSSAMSVVAAIAYAVGASAGVHWTRPRRRRLLIVGGGSCAATLAAEIAARPHGRYQFIGVVEDRAPGSSNRLMPRLGRISGLERIIAAMQPDHIAIASVESDREQRVMSWLLGARLHGVVVEDVSAVLERVTGKVAIEAVSQTDLLRGEGFLHADFGPSDVYRALTRVWNVGIAAIGLLVLSPLLTLVAILVTLDSPGDMFFVQRRIGADGRPFGLIKFRTMADAAERRSEWARDNTSRITRVGHWLRRFRLDELPQLVNVLRGHMNFVGPRPHPESNYQLFCEHIPLYGCRASVRPGITGWAQVRMGYANGLEEETEKMRYDLYYIKHRSFGLDARILLETVLVVLVERAWSLASPQRRDVAWSQVPSGVALR
jgi:exopolysaccharide biosynthesis polyprenyl glycosylphosphotransferase